MSTATTPSPIQREPALLGQTVILIGGSAGIGLETGRRARAEGAKLILTGRNPERLGHAARTWRAAQCGVRRHRLRAPR
jgi:short-subunit dehydrogenase involved in D-alanine esterification of teichoic acids